MNSKLVLIVTHHFPPDNAVGAVRPTKFAKYLPRFGWEPIVLTVKENYYQATDATNNDDIKCKVIRSGFVRSTSHYYRKIKRALVGNDSIKSVGAQTESTAVRGRPTLRDWINALTAFPDEDTGWVPFALLKGKKVIKE